MRLPISWRPSGAHQDGEDAERQREIAALEEVADLAANAAAMFELRRADVVTILVDGRRLCSPADRADTIAAIPLIVQGLIENGAFVRGPHLAITLTKNDCVSSAPKADRAMRDFESIVENIRKRFSQNFSELCSFVTCASPRDPNAVRGEGLGDLLAFWLTPPAEPKETRLQVRSERVFDDLRIEEEADGE